MTVADRRSHPDVRPLERLVLVGTGSRTVHTLPAWVDWLRDSCPELEMTIVVTRSAERFVTTAALQGRAGEVHRDAWPDGDGTAWHVRWATWADAIVVFPATMGFVARLALGLADSPALLAAQCTTAPVVLAPAVPPGGVQSAAYQMHHRTLMERPNVVIVPPVPVTSATTGRRDGWGAPPLGEVLQAAARRRAELDVPSAVPDVADSLAEGA